MAEPVAVPPPANVTALYKKATPFNAEAHGALGVKAVDAPFKFASRLHICPITAAEFGAAALQYPIIFVGEPRMPAVVMGLKAGENLFFDANGRLEDDAYMPAYIRRYPFIFAEDKAQDRYVVCIDEQAEMVGPNADRPFFDGGQPSAFSNAAIEFLKTIEQQRRITEQLMQLFNDLDLLEDRDVTLNQTGPDGAPKPIRIADYKAVSMQKLNAVSPETLAQLRDSGALSAIYTHLASLLNWQRLINRALRKAGPVRV